MNKIANTKTLNVQDIVAPLARGIEHALFNVDTITCDMLQRAEQTESCQQAKWAMQQLILNNKIAAQTNSFACQDCGQAVLFVEYGSDLQLIGDLSSALNSGVELGYTDARKSVADPITRLNTHTNTPAIIHYNIVSGSTLKITYLAKGAGSENMSRIYMLTPSKGEKGIIDSVLDCVIQAGANPCPPIILGIGIGGTFESAALLSKKALTIKSNQKNPRDDLRILEDKITAAVNSSGIGAQGFGGDTTCLASHILAAPTHIGMLPVAINIQCHSVRHFSIEF